MENQNSKSVQWLAIAIIVASVIISGTVLYTSSKKQNTNTGNSQPQGQEQNGQPTAAAADISKVKLAGEPSYGNINAPVVMAYWSDYQCPFCQRNEQQVMPEIIKNYVAAGKVRIVFKDFAFLGVDSQTLGKFARAVWDVAPDKFYQWHKAMFDNQGTENTGWATQSKIMSITTNVLGASDANKVLSLVKSKGNAYQQQMDADKTEGGNFGITGTPSAVIGKQLIVGAQAYDTFKSAIDAVSNGK